MAGKRTGMGMNAYVGGVDISGDAGSIKSIHGGVKMGMVTGIDKYAVERIKLLADGGFGVSTWFNDVAAGTFQKLKLLPTTDVIGSLGIGTTLGDQGCAVVAKQVNYDGQRDKEGNLFFEADLLANGYGLEWGNQLTAGIRSDTTATNGTSVDLGSASPGAFGAQFYLHGFSFTGTSCTVKIQESSDNGAGDAFADVVGGGFTAITGVTSQRIATGLINVERYLRVVTTGTFSQCSFAVLGIRNPIATSF